MKGIIIALAIAVALIWGAVALSNKKPKIESMINENNVTMVDGKQIIEIKAKGGYLPRRSVAKAGVPTILRVNTNGTLDCSSAIRIPTMNIGKNLPMSGTTEIDLGNPKIGILQGACGMGMYPFEIDFQN